MRGKWEVGNSDLSSSEIRLLFHLVMIVFIWITTKVSLGSRNFSIGIEMELNAQKLPPDWS
jgi:hypothetical protein